MAIDDFLFKSEGRQGDDAKAVEGFLSGKRKKVTKILLGSVLGAGLALGLASFLGGKKSSETKVIAAVEKTASLQRSLDERAFESDLLKDGGFSYGVYVNNVKVGNNVTAITHSNDVELSAEVRLPQKALSEESGSRQPYLVVYPYGTEDRGLMKIIKLKTNSNGNNVSASARYRARLAMGKHSFRMGFYLPTQKDSKVVESFSYYAEDTLVKLINSGNAVVTENPDESSWPNDFSSNGNSQKTLGRVSNRSIIVGKKVYDMVKFNFEYPTAVQRVFHVDVKEAEKPKIPQKPKSTYELYQEKSQKMKDENSKKVDSWLRTHVGVLKAIANYESSKDHSCNQELVKRTEMAVEYYLPYVDGEDVENDTKILMNRAIKGYNISLKSPIRFNSFSRSIYEKLFAAGLTVECKSPRDPYYLGRSGYCSEFIINPENINASLDHLSLDNIDGIVRVKEKQVLNDLKNDCYNERMNKKYSEITGGDSSKSGNR